MTLSERPAPSTVVRAPDVAVVGAIVAVYTAAAIAAFPQMDDALLVLLMKEQGPSAIVGASLDRPLVGGLWQFVATHAGRAFWPLGFLFHFLFWLALGLLTCALWRRLAPAQARFAPLAGALAVAPIVVRTQLSTVTVTLICLLSVVPVYAAALIAYRFVDGGDRTPLVVALALVAAGAVLTEYGAVAAVSAAVLLAVGASGDLTRGARARRAAIAFVGVAVAGYLAYASIGDFSRRPSLDPTQRLPRSAMVVRVPFSALTRFWDAAGGAIARRAGDASVEWQSKSSLLALAFAAGIGALCAAVARRSAGGDASDSGPVPGRVLLAPAAALAVGVLPIAWMRPVLRSAFGTRFQIPILPSAAMLTVGVLLAVTRPRLHVLVAAAVGAIVGWSIIQESADGFRQRQRMAAIGRVLEPIVRAQPAVTLAIMPAADLCHTAQVCTGAATRDWPAELSERVWLESEEDALGALGPRASCRAPALSGLAERGFRRGPVGGEPIWIRFDGDRPVAEPYCVAR